MRISNWSSDVCSSDLVCCRPSVQVPVNQPGLPSSGFLYFVLAIPPPVHVGKLPPRASTRHSFVIGGTQAGYCVGPPGLEMHRTTSHAQILSDATAGEIGRASCREIVGQLCAILVVGSNFKKKHKKQ